MQRTQISLTGEARALLDAEAKRTGRSVAALIRDAVVLTYGAAGSGTDDLAALAGSFGGWVDSTIDGELWVEQRRSGSRLAHG